MSWANVASIGASVIGAWSSNRSAKKNAEAASQTGQFDPRVANILFGQNGQQGLLGRYQGMLDTPRSGAANLFGNANSSYLANYGGADLDAARYAAYGAMNNTSAPTTTAAQAGGAWMIDPAWAVGNQVQAPGQNKLDLTGSYDRFINGAPGANPFLDKSIDGAIAQNRLGFQQMQADSTKNLMQSILPSIRSNSVLSGQYGGSRQGVAEGSAIGTHQTEMARAASQFGQNATNAAVNAKAGAYETDSNRALAATQGLGAQQYGVAQQDTNTKNQAEFTNVGTHNNVLQTNANMAQQNNQFNAGLQQQAGLANQQSQLSTNGQNKSSNLAGAGLLSGLLGQVQGNVNANDNWDLSRALGVNSLLAPYLSSAPRQNPVASNSGAAALGGGMAGLGFGSQLGSLFGGSKSSGGSSAGGFSDLFGSGGWGTSGSFF